MTRSEHLQQLILKSYEIISKNEEQILFSNEPKVMQRLDQENEEHWNRIERYLTELTNLLKATPVGIHSDIIQIAASRFPELAIQINNHHSQPETISTESKVNEYKIPQTQLFDLNYQFVQPCVSQNTDPLVQFTLDISSRDDIVIPQDHVKTHICLVLDVSGSMNTDKKFPYLLEAIPFVIERLADDDWLSIILFSRDSELLLSTEVGDCRFGEQKIIDDIRTSKVLFQTTHLAPGLKIAIQTVDKCLLNTPGIVSRMYILTDGQLHDPDACQNLNSELKRLEVEINSYGFGDDFADDTMRNIMSGCMGGRIKSITDTDTLQYSFSHLGEVAQNIIATDGELHIEFFPEIILGDTFRYQPGTQRINPDPHEDELQITIGSLEKARIYTFAFEARLNPAMKNTQRICTARLYYTFSGEKFLAERKVIINRTEDPRQLKEKNKEVENIFLILDGLKSNDPKIIAKSLQARLEILIREGGDYNQIQLLMTALEKLRVDGTLEGLSEFQKRRLGSDGRSTVVGYH